MRLMRHNNELRVKRMLRLLEIRTGNGGFAAYIPQQKLKTIIIYRFSINNLRNSEIIYSFAA
jgi:hypothetical protein